MDNNKTLVKEITEMSLANILGQSTRQAREIIRDLKNQHQRIDAVLNTYERKLRFQRWFDIGIIAAAAIFLLAYICFVYTAAAT